MLFFVSIRLHVLTLDISVHISARYKPSFTPKSVADKTVQQESFINSSNGTLIFSEGVDGGRESGVALSSLSLIN